MFSAEIQQIYQDGTLVLQTRNLRYGKLNEGILIHVRSSLVKRTKNHFHSLPCGASVIRGCNGAIWIQSFMKTTGRINLILKINLHLLIQFLVNFNQIVDHSFCFLIH